MAATLTWEERAAFKRCRREWDLGGRCRRNLEPDPSPAVLDADRVLRDALAVYYFPGMWDWSRDIVLPLVTRALKGSVARQRQQGAAGAELEGRAAASERLLAAYLAWIPGVERLGPVLVEVDYEVDLPDPDRPDVGLLTAAGTGVRYRGRVDLLAVDEHDAYWIVRHRVVDEWTGTDGLVRDEEALGACWAWERFYLGMEIAGTVHNELRLPTDAAGATAASEPPAGTSQGPTPVAVRQHEPSGGGRSLPHHRRLYARASEPAAPERISCESGPWFRRTWIRRSRHEVEEAGRQLAIEARTMLAPDVAVYPSPSETACGRCPFAAPCLAMYEGGDAEAVLAAGYRRRPPEEPSTGRLGAKSWSMGRGAAPPTFPQQTRLPKG